MILLKAGADFAGRYEIVRVLSTGGMGVVYEVLHRDTQRKRALKLMLPSLLADDDMRARFAREAIVTAGIESEHLVEVFDAGVEKESGCPFLVMEMLRGEDLGARLLRQELTSPRDVLEIFDQLARALVRTHEGGIIHRDLKPENIFVTHRDDGTLRMKILDFGIAKLVDRGGKSTRSVGTPIYMAPEQMTGKGVGATADLYALAQIAFTLLVGAPYFQKEADTAENILGLMHSVGAGTVEPATVRGEALGVHLPKAFDAWFARATHRDATARFASVRQQVDALHGILDDAPDALPRSSGAKRRATAFGATEAMVDPGASEPGASGGAGAGSRQQEALAPANVDRSAAPARTHVSAPMSASSTQSTAGPSSRTLGGESSAAPVSRMVPALIAIAVVGAAAIGITLTLRASGDPPAPAFSSEPTSSAGSPPGDPAPPASSAAAGPMVAPAPSETVPRPRPELAPSASTSASPVSSAKATPRGTGPVPPAKPSVSAAAPPPPSSTPPPPAGTVWGGPRR